MKIKLEIETTQTSISVESVDFDAIREILDVVSKRPLRVEKIDGEVKRMYDAEGLVSAIKLHRDRVLEETGERPGLKESKEYVEKLVNHDSSLPI